MNSFTSPLGTRWGLGDHLSLTSVLDRSRESPCAACARPGIRLRHRPSPRLRFRVRSIEVGEERLARLLLT